MTEGAVGPGWYPDPENPGQLRHWDGYRWAPRLPPARPDVSRVFGLTWVYCIAIGVITGLGSGTVAVPLFGTMAGAVLGLVVGVVLGLVIAAVLAAAARPEVSAATYRLTVNITLGIVGLASTGFAVLWFHGVVEEIALRGAVAIFAFAVVCLLVVRPRLIRLVPDRPASR